MAYSFGTSGALPDLSGSLSGNGSALTLGGTPASKALSFAGASAPSSALSTVKPATNTQTTTPAFSKPVDFSQYATTSGLIPKSQTVTNPDGSSHTTTYQAPATDPSTSSTSGSSGNSGMLQTSPFAVTPAEAAAGGTPAQIAAKTGQNPPSTATPDPSTTSGMLSVGSNPTPASVAGTLGDLSLNGSPTVAANIKELQDYEGQVASALATVGNTPGPLGNQIGREANINSTAALKEQALQTGISNALQEQNLQQSGLGTAAGILNPSNQFTQVSPGNIAINSSGQSVASAPSYQPIGQTVAVSPTPNLAGGTAGEPSSYTIKSGDTLNAIAAANGISEASLQAANPNATATDLQPGQTLNIPSSASTSGTPFQAGVVAGQQANGTQYAQNYSAYQQAESIRSNINSIISSNPNLNPSVFTSANQALQFLNGQVSNPAYAILANNVAEYVNTLAPILGVGGDTTNYKTALAQQFLQGAASGQSMSQIMNGIAQTAALKLNTQASAGGSTGTVSAPASSGSSGGTPMFGSFNGS